MHKILQLFMLWQQYVYFMAIIYIFIYKVACPYVCIYVCMTVVNAQAKKVKPCNSSKYRKRHINVYIVYGCVSVCLSISP